MPKPVRTLNIYDKGSNYLITDTDDLTPLYHVHWNTITLPHMTVTHASPDSSNPLIGSASFIPQKLGGFFSSADDIHLELHGHKTIMAKKTGVFSTDKRFFETSSQGQMCWKGGVAISGFLTLEDANKQTVAAFKNTAYSGRVFGVFEIYADPLGQEELDELVVSGLAMISEQKTGMTGTAASLANAGAMN